MRNNAKSARVIQVPKGHLARPLRLYLEAAGVKRAELFVTDKTRKAVTFHDLRATGITWCAVRGDDALKIKQRAGHASFSTTEGYIREAENLRQGFGDVFPPLPDGLVGSPADEGGAAPDSVIEASVAISGARSSQKQAQSSGVAGNRTRAQCRNRPQWCRNRRGSARRLRPKCADCDSVWANRRGVHRGASRSRYAGDVQVPRHADA